MFHVNFFTNFHSENELHAVNDDFIAQIQVAKREAAISTRRRHHAVEVNTLSAFHLHMKIYEVGCARVRNNAPM